MGFVFGRCCVSGGSGFSSSGFFVFFGGFFVFFVVGIICFYEFNESYFSGVVGVFVEFVDVGVVIVVIGEFFVFFVEEKCDGGFVVYVVESEMVEMESVFCFGFG